MLSLFTSCTLSLYFRYCSYIKYIHTFLHVSFLQNRRLTALPTDLMASSMTREAWVNSSTDEGTQDSTSMSQSVADTTFIVESTYAHKYMYTVHACTLYVHIQCTCMYTVRACTLYVHIHTVYVHGIILSYVEYLFSQDMLFKETIVCFILYPLSEIPYCMYKSDNVPFILFLYNSALILVYALAYVFAIVLLYCLYSSMTDFPLLSSQLPRLLLN